MSDTASSKTHAAGIVDREISLQEAIGAFCDPELERRWHRAKAQPVYYTGPQRVWATGEIHQVKRRDLGPRFTEEQIAFALRQAETGTAAAEVIRKMGVSEQTFYRWKKQYAGMGIGELRRMKQLEEENRKLKQLVADLSLDKAMLQDVIRSKL